MEKQSKDIKNNETVNKKIIKNISAEIDNTHTKESIDKKLLKKEIILILVISSLCSLATYYFVTKSYNNTQNNNSKEIIKTDENIVFLGDSITEQYDINKYYNNHRVINSGVGGNSTLDILDNLNKRVYIYNPSKVFLLIGTNDLADQFEEEEIYNNIVKIVNKIKKNRPYCKIYVESIYPVNNSNNKKIKKKSVTYRKNEIINSINNKLKEKYKIGKVTYIDVNKELLDNDNLLDINYTVDGVHITEEGYEKITSILLPYINE